MSNKKVLVALSGGVDSSVSAALLKEQGYDVEGAFIVTWTAPWLPCTWREERLDAIRVSAHLRIPFHTIDLSKEYERDVVTYLVREYREGRTPNPDVMCNKFIKFGGLFVWAMEHGFDYVATGHYARVVGGEQGVKGGETQTSDHQLLCGKDARKDQTYFLWTLTQHHLAHTLFPVGGYEKPKVRELAMTYGLPTAQKKDSQGVCFLGKIDMKEFLQHYIPTQEGLVLDTDGEVIGKHDGAMFVTLGQRHGFEVSAQSPDTPPLYIVAKNVTNNTITVAPRHTDTASGACTHLTLTDVNWINGRVQTPEFSCAGRLRYRQPLFDCTLIEVTDTTASVTLAIPQEYIPVGQSLVLYSGDVCLGGGVIDSVTK